MEVRECFSSPEILKLMAQCELARYRGAAPSRLQCTFGLAGNTWNLSVVFLNFLQNSLKKIVK